METQMNTKNLLEKLFNKKTLLFPHIIIMNTGLSIFFWGNSKQEVNEILKGTSWKLGGSDRILVEKVSAETKSAPWQSFEEFAFYLTSEECRIPESLIVQIDTLPEKFTITFAPFKSSPEYTKAITLCDEIVQDKNFLFEIEKTQIKDLLTLIVNR